MKVCTKCRKSKDCSEFHSNGRGGLRANCKVCHLDHKKAQGNVYYAENKEKWKQYNTNKKNSGYYQEYYKTNADKFKEYREKHYKYDKEYHRNYYQEHKKENAAISAKRRAQKLNATLEGYDREIVEIYKNCPKDHSVDHIHPLINDSVCGLHVPWNLQYLTKKDNLKKSNKFDGTVENEGWETQN